MLIWCRLTGLLQFTDNNHNEATPANPHTAATLFNQKAVFLRHFCAFLFFFFFKAVSSKKSTGLSPCEAELYKLYRVFRSGHIGSACIRWGTWFIAAVIGPVWWLISLAHFLSPHFPPLRRATVFPAGCFIQGSVFLECYALGSQLPLWQRKRPRFIRVGMVLYVWLIALHEWKWGLVCEKRAMPHHTCSKVILEDSGRWSGLFYKFWGVRSLKDSAWHRTHQKESFTRDKTLIFKLRTTDK